MFKILKSSWALFTGYFILMVAHGFQGNLLGVRSVIEEFNFIATGSIMSGYFVGYFIGANSIPNLVGRVGHIRVFAALASMASLSILIHAVFVNPIIWTMARFITGFALVGIFIVMESWLNDRANNRTRGQLLSVYMFITLIGISLGSLLLNFSSPDKYEPFILISLLLSFALIPILLTKRKAPKFKKQGFINIKGLFKTSPLATVSMFCTGLIHSALFSLGAVYAAKMNFTIFEISLLLFIITVCGGLFQWPIGYFSDKSDRRLIIIICTFVAAVFAFLAIYVSGASLENMYLAISADRNKILFFLFFGIYAGMAIPLFTLNLAYVNDYMEKAKFVSAGAGMQIIFGLGAMMGPFLCSTLMSAFGTNGFFIYLLIFHLIIGLFGLYRITRREAVENPDNTFTPLPRNITPAGLELDPDADVDLSSK
jgi:MFS family permease